MNMLTDNQRMFICSMAVVSIFLITTGIWIIDISLAALLNDLVLTNGFAINDPMQMYHIGLYLCGGVSVLMAVGMIIVVNWRN